MSQIKKEKQRRNLSFNLNMFYCLSRDLTTFYEIVGLNFFMHIPDIISILFSYTFISKMNKKKKVFSIFSTPCSK